MASTNVVVVAGVQAQDAVPTSSQVHLGPVTRGLRWSVATHSSVTLRLSSPAHSIVVNTAGNAGEDAGKTRKRNTGNAMSSTVYTGNAMSSTVRPKSMPILPCYQFLLNAIGCSFKMRQISTTKLLASKWVKIETEATTSAFTPEKQHETELTGGLAPAGNNRIMINLDFADMEAAHKHAISQGATPVASPEDKKWPQKVGYVKDFDGNMVRLGSFPAM